MPGNTWVEQENLDLIETNINQLQISINNLSYDVGRILSALNRGTTPTSLTIDVASGNTQASSSNLEVVPQIDIADDDLSIVVHVAALGSSFVTVSNGVPLPVSRMVGSTSTMPGRNAICRRSATSTFGRTAFNCRSGSKTRSSAFRC